MDYAYYIEQNDGVKGEHKPLAQSDDPKVIQQALDAEKASNGDTDRAHYFVLRGEKLQPAAKASVEYTV